MAEWHYLAVSLSKLTLAAAVGGVIGFERESHGQSAGLRTNLLVCVGACLMMQLSLFMEELFRNLPVATSVVRLDPGRIASYAIASMGFLGAGAIITGKGSVRGLTTAASLWLVTGIGLTIGAGYLSLALFTALVSIVCLYALRRAKAWFKRDTFTILTLKYRGLEDHLDLVKNILTTHGLQINFAAFKRELAEEVTSYRLHLESKENIPWTPLVKVICESPELIEVEWREGEVQ